MLRTRPLFESNRSYYLHAKFCPIRFIIISDSTAALAYPSGYAFRATMSTNEIAGNVMLFGAEKAWTYGVIGFAVGSIILFCYRRMKLAASGIN